MQLHVQIHIHAAGIQEGYKSQGQQLMMRCVALDSRGDISLADTCVTYSYEIYIDRCHACMDGWMDGWVWAADRMTTGSRSSDACTYGADGGDIMQRYRPCSVATSRRTSIVRAQQIQARTATYRPDPDASYPSDGLETQAIIIRNFFLIFLGCVRHPFFPTHFSLFRTHAFQTAKRLFVVLSSYSRLLYYGT
uniref:Uncharacterized protein n=1 Tax=Oryza sativa subsp. japonica TaxID=39947 RepID=Q60ES5_ORYSJ|nr:hypothetical protein [Oryza sativa Japonica Group]